MRALYVSTVDLIGAIVKRQAELAVGASTARGQGVAGVVRALRNSLANVPLTKFSVSTENAFVRNLEKQTQYVKSRLPRPARSWGLARKCLNIYLRDCFYNHYLRKHFGLGSAEGFFEVPLDAVMTKGLGRWADRGTLPHWKGIKRLKRKDSMMFQQAARTLAAEWGITRVHLDTFLFVEGRRMTPNPLLPRTSR
jgi:hypothetical protein